MTSLLFRGSLSLVVGFAHLFSGSRIGSAWGVLTFLLAGSLIVWGSLIVSVRVSLVVLGESNRFLLGESNNFQGDTCALTSPCVVAHARTATVISKNTAGIVHCREFCTKSDDVCGPKYYWTMLLFIGNALSSDIVVTQNPTNIANNSCHIYHKLIFT